MSDWTEDNFGNADAREYLTMLTARLVGTINEVLADKTRIRPHDDGEGMLMPAVEVLALLCERYDAAPPHKPTIKQWRDKYLAAFDAGFSNAQRKPARRRFIEQTFRWLEGLAETYYENEADKPKG